MGLIESKFEGRMLCRWRNVYRQGKKSGARNLSMMVLMDIFGNGGRTATENETSSDWLVTPGDSGGTGGRGGLTWQAHCEFIVSF